MRFASKRRPPRRLPQPQAEPLHHAGTMPPHGAVIGRILIEYHGQRVEAEIRQAGERCRTHGVSIAGGPVELMGLYRAAALVSARVARAPGLRSGVRRDVPVSARDDADAAAAQMEMMA
jgi:hypothetical protein